MFDLEKTIVNWRRQMLGAGIKSPALNELESHLREDMERQIKSGVDRQRAFEMAVSRIGPAETLRQEFKKSEWSSEKKWGVFALLAGAALLLRVCTHHQMGQPWKNDQLGWILFSAIALFGGLNTVFLKFNLGDTREIRLWKLAGITYSVVAVWISLLPLLRAFMFPSFSATDRLLAVSAVAASSLSIFGWRRCRRMLPVIQSRRIRTAIGILCCLAGPAFMSSFFYFIFPQLGRFPAPLFFALLAWLWATMAILGGAGYGLAEAAREHAGDEPEQWKAQYV